MLLFTFFALLILTESIYFNPNKSSLFTLVVMKSIFVSSSEESQRFPMTKLHLLIRLSSRIQRKKKNHNLVFWPKKMWSVVSAIFFFQDFSMGTSFYLHSVLLLTPLLTSPCDAFDPLIITTKKGQVQGKFVPVQHNQVGAFLGIPYGKPPVGKLRFRPPVPADRWEGVKDATEYPNSCFQPNLTHIGRFGV